MALLQTPSVSVPHPTTRQRHPYEQNLVHDVNPGERSYYDRAGGLDVRAALGAGTIYQGFDYLGFDGVADTLMYSSLVGLRNCPPNCAVMQMPQANWTVELTIGTFVPTAGLSILLGGGSAVPGQFGWAISQTAGMIDFFVSPDGLALDLAQSAATPVNGTVITVAVNPATMAIFFDGEAKGIGPRSAPTVNITNLFAFGSAFGAVHSPLSFSRFRMWDVTIDPQNPDLYEPAVIRSGV